MGNDKQTHSGLSGYQPCRTGNVSARNSPTCFLSGRPQHGSTSQCGRRTRLGWVLLAWVPLGSALFAGQASAALTLSPAAAAVPLGGPADSEDQRRERRNPGGVKNTAVVTVVALQPDEHRRDLDRRRRGCRQGNRLRP